jgi:hypothetical protein
MMEEAEVGEAPQSAVQVQKPPPPLPPVPVERTLHSTARTVVAGLLATL